MLGSCSVSLPHPLALLLLLHGMVTGLTLWMLSLAIPRLGEVLQRDGPSPGCFEGQRGDKPRQIGKVLVDNLLNQDVGKAPESRPAHRLDVQSPVLSCWGLLPFLCSVRDVAAPGQRAVSPRPLLPLGDAVQSAAP